MTEDEAKSYIENTVVMLTRWDGEYNNYYSKEGAAFVNTKHNYMKSAFKSDEYDADAKAMMEVLKKWKLI